jgi:L-aminopeptidase/D-esterase-like protein
LADRNRKLRAREIGVPFAGTTGLNNAITDVADVMVGHTTLISGEGPLRVGAGPVRTGVTAILPRGPDSASPLFAGWFSLNGNGEMTGTAWIDEAGLLTTPVLLTNTHSVGTVRDTVIAWMHERWRIKDAWSLPVVAETWDGRLNDINGFHVRPEHVKAALDGAACGPVAEGSVGGGTGMICYEFKGGIGTSSRVLTVGARQGVVGALVQANHGIKRQLIVAGVPVGLELSDPSVPAYREGGSILVVLATDLPLLPNQCRALAKRASLGLARTGGIAAISSGDLFLAFSTANLAGADVERDVVVTMLGLGEISTLYEAAVDATEEAIVNALIAAETMSGIDGYTVEALAHDRLRAVLARYRRLNGPIRRRA